VERSFQISMLTSKDGAPRSTCEPLRRFTGYHRLHRARGRRGASRTAVVTCPTTGGHPAPRRPDPTIFLRALPHPPRLRDATTLRVYEAIAFEGARVQPAMGPCGRLISDERLTGPRWSLRRPQRRQLSSRRGSGGRAKHGRYSTPSAAKASSGSHKHRDEAGFWSDDARRNAPPT
jgi:hypothetical protein